MRLSAWPWRFTAAFLALLLRGAATLCQPVPPEVLHAAPGGLEWNPIPEFGEVLLTVADPAGEVRTFRFGAGEPPALPFPDERGAPPADGTYTWELRAEPLAEGAAPLVRSGHFTLSAGSLVPSDLLEAPDTSRRSGASAKPRTAVGADQTVPDDLIVDGKGCIGLGCTNNEPFGSEALRLKQSVVRLRFEDTSTGAGFPGNDWQITANDSASGGADRFSVEDLGAGRTPLTIRAGAPDNSLYVTGAGRVGLGTATPAERLHILESADANTIVTSENSGIGLSSAGVLRAKSNSAIVNFQAHGSGRTLARFGQPLASWAEFLQVTGNGLIIGTLTDKPLILGTNNANRVHVAPDGSVGLGTTAPAAQLHVSSSAAGGKALFENTNATAAAREMFEVRNKGGATMIFDDTNDPARWANTALGPSFLFNNQANAGVEFTFGPTGDLAISGNLTAANFPSSSRELKQDFAAVDPDAILSRLVRMPIQEWTFKDDPERRRHIGPTVEDFSAAFGLGTSGRSLVSTDVDGVALTAIQGLHALLAEQRQVIARQQELIEHLEERLRRLEAHGNPEPEED